MFLPSTFFLFYWVYAVCRQVAGAVGHMGYLVIEELGIHGPPACGCRASNVRQ